MQNKQDWEKRFDEMVGANMCCGCEKDHEDYRRFIATELERQRAEFVEAVEAKKNKGEVVLGWGELTPEQFAYNQALNDVLAILEKARE